MNSKYALLWRQDGSEGIYWYIRGIKPDGTFYGDIKYRSKNSALAKAASVDGQISEDRWQSCKELLTNLEDKEGCEPRECFARIGRWKESLGDVELVFFYDKGDENLSADARAFLQLTDGLERELKKFYPMITAAHGATLDS